MDENQIKHILEAALLAAGRPLPFDTLASLFSSRASELDKESLTRALDALAEDYRERGIELKEVASGYRIQIRSSMSDWLTPLWEERAPRYTRALMETLALIAYRQPITRAEIEEVRGVAVSTNIVRTLMERNWIRVVGHRDVPGKPAMFGTTKDFLDYFGLKKLEDLPALADVKDGFPELSPQNDLIDALAVGTEGDVDGDESLVDSESDEVAIDGGRAAERQADDAGADNAGADDAGADDAGADDAGAEAAGAEDAGAEDAGTLVEGDAHTHAAVEQSLADEDHPSAAEEQSAARAIEADDQSVAADEQASADEEFSEAEAR